MAQQHSTEYRISSDDRVLDPLSGIVWPAWQLWISAEDCGDHVMNIPGLTPDIFYWVQIRIKALPYVDGESTVAVSETQMFRITLSGIASQIVTYQTSQSQANVLSIGVSLVPASAQAKQIEALAASSALTAGVGSVQIIDLTTHAVSVGIGASVVSTQIAQEEDPRASFNTGATVTIDASQIAQIHAVGASIGATASIGETQVAQTENIPYANYSAPASDTTAPTFDSATINVSGLVATGGSITNPYDNVGITGYMIRGIATAPSATSPTLDDGVIVSNGWQSVFTNCTATKAAAGMISLYVFAKDAAGNIGTSSGVSVTFVAEVTLDSFETGWDGWIPIADVLTGSLSYREAGGYGVSGEYRIFFIAGEDYYDEDLEETIPAVAGMYKVATAAGTASCYVYPAPGPLELRVNEEVVESVTEGSGYIYLSCPVIEGDIVSIQISSGYGAVDDCYVP